MLHITVGLLGLILYILLDFLKKKKHHSKEIFHSHSQLIEDFFKKLSPNLLTKKKISVMGPFKIWV